MSVHGPLHPPPPPLLLPFLFCSVPTVTPPVAGTSVVNAPNSCAVERSAQGNGWPSVDWQLWLLTRTWCRQNGMRRAEGAYIEGEWRGACMLDRTGRFGTACFGQARKHSVRLRDLRLLERSFALQRLPSACACRRLVPDTTASTPKTRASLLWHAGNIQYISGLDIC